MMMGCRMMTDHDLDSLFAAARADSPAPSAALTTRVLADADAAMVRTPAAKIAPTSASGAGASLWTKLAALFGGAGAVAGMATATVAGFYIGFAQPMNNGLLPAVLGGEIAELEMMPGLDALLDEAP